MLTLPERGKPSSATPQEIAKIFIDSPTKCDLSIVGSETLLGGNRGFILNCADTPDGIRSWTVIAPPLTQLGRNMDIGVFSLKGQSLRYAWMPSGVPSLSGRNLPYCLLHIRIGEDNERCFLSRPLEELDPISVDVDHKTSGVEIKLDVASLPDPKHLRLDLKLDTRLKHEMRPESGWKVGDTGEIRFFSGNGDGEEGRLDIKTTLTLGASPRLSFKLFALDKEVSSSGIVTEKEIPVFRRWFKLQQRKLAAKMKLVEVALKKIEGQLDDLNKPRAGSSASSSLSNRRREQIRALEADK